MTRTVVYPIANGNYTDSNVDLIMSLRSLEKHLECDFRVVVISEREPMYLSEEVFFVKCQGYRDALRLACSLDSEFLWMNDDISFLKDHSWEDLQSWVRGDTALTLDRVNALCDGSGWSKRKGQVLRKLAEEGRSTYDFSTHLPYMYRSDLLAPILQDTSWDFGYKTPVETIYGNVNQVIRREECRKLSRHHDGHLPLDTSTYHFLNYADSADLPHVRGFLLGRFPSPSRFESVGSLDPSTLTLDKIK